MSVLHVYILRHGETEENRQYIIQGQLNTQLNELGREQARRVALALSKEPFDYAFVSDLDRAVETAQTILGYHPGIQLQKDPGLRERFYGELQGKRRTFAGDPPSAEPFEAFKARCLAWWDTTLLPLAKATSTSRSLTPTPTATPSPRINVLVVGHGAYIANLLKGLISHRNIDGSLVGPIARVLNTGITILEIHPEGHGRILQFSKADHLADHHKDDTGVTQRNADEA